MPNAFENARLQEKLGTPNIKHWSSVYSFARDGETVVLVLTISPKAPVFDLKSQGEEILGYFENRYKSEQIPPTSARVQALAKTVVTRFEDAAVALQIAVLQGEVIHLCTIGGGEISLLRGENTYKLISKENLEGKSLSGPIKNGDKFTLSSGEDDYSSSVEVSPVIIPKVEQEPAIEAGSAVPNIAAKNKFAFKLPQIRSPKEIFNTLFKKDKTATYKEEAAPKNTVISVGIILLVLLFASIGLGLVQKSRKENIAKYETRLLEAEQAFEDSRAQAPLNPRVAKDLYLKAQSLVGVLKEEGVTDERLLSLDTKLQENAALLLGVVDAKPSTFLDLSLVRSGLEPVEIVLDQEKIAVLDKGGDRVITVLTDASGTAVLGGSEKVGSLTSVATYAGRVFTLSEKGILEVSTSGNTTVAVEPDSEWGNPLKVRAFGSNLYIMTLEGEIWRFPAASKGFASKQRWLGPGVILSSSPLDLAMDGSVWVLSTGSRIQKYTRGAPNSFSVKDITFSEATALYTDENTESLFILDANNARIAQLSKTGDLEKEYKSEEFKEAKDLVVSAKSEKIFILTPTKILEIPLSQ